MKKLLALGVAAALILGFWVLQGWNGAGPSKRAVAVVIPRGASLPRAAALLEEAGAIASSNRFLLQAKLFGHGRGIKAGEYEIPPGASDAKILWMLQNGKTLQRFVVIPEGLPSIMAWERLAAAPALTGDVPVPEEGSILPDSYSYQRGDSRASVLQRMQAAMAKTL